MELGVVEVAATVQDGTNILDAGEVDVILKHSGIVEHDGAPDKWTASGNGFGVYCTVDDQELAVAVGFARSTSCMKMFLSAQGFVRMPV